MSFTKECILICHHKQEWLVRTASLLILPCKLMHEEKLFAKTRVYHYHSSDCDQRTTLNTTVCSIFLLLLVATWYPYRLKDLDILLEIESRELKKSKGIASRVFSRLCSTILAIPAQSLEINTIWIEHHFQDIVTKLWLANCVFCAKVWPWKNLISQGLVALISSAVHGKLLTSIFAKEWMILVIFQLLVAEGFNLYFCATRCCVGAFLWKTVWCKSH